MNEILTELAPSHLLGLLTPEDGTYLALLLLTLLGVLSVLLQAPRDHGAGEGH